MNWIFFINWATTEMAFIVVADTQDEAIKIAHGYLRNKHPKVWTSKWEDLRTDIVETGEQTLYGPFDKVPTIEVY